MGANKAFNRGLFDRYQTNSVLSGANSNGSSIDKQVAEIMAAEKKEFESKDLVMVPSMKSNTGWKYIQGDQLEKIRNQKHSMLPGLKGAINNNAKKLEPIGKDDPN